MTLELPPLSAEDFAAFVQAVHGHSPFPWQEDLLEQALHDQWPSIRVPTGLGKTSVVDVAVFALAMQADLPPDERTARTRTFVIIDRRVVVDDVTAHAERLRSALAGGREDVVRRVAARLRHIAFGPTSAAEPDALRAPGSAPLTVTRMRGGTTWAARWIDRPEQPAVIVGTVDQLASRFLFRGYGVSRGSRPIDAALVGSDSLIVLDEAHLARPLRETIDELLAFERSVPIPVLPRRQPRLVVMSATVEPKGTTPLDVSERDLAHPEAGKRLRACKLVKLWSFRGGPRESREARRALARLLALAAERLAGEGEVAVVGVVCNTVETARTVHETLLEAGKETQLLIGPSREIDRELVMRRVRPAAGIQRARECAPASPIFVVATQTIEVGVNLDFDALVTEAAPLDSLAQRLGRLDRLGERTAKGLTTRALVVRSDAVHAEDRLYGEPLARTWSWLAQLVEPEELSSIREATTAPLDSELDLGPEGLRRHTRGVDAESLAAPSPRRVTVLPLEHVSEWTQTSPTPLLDPDIEPFIRGDEPVRPTVLVAWRADVLGDSKSELVESARLSLARRPLASQEQVECPLWHVDAWLAGRREQAASEPLPDAPVGTEPEAPAESGQSRRAVRVGEGDSCEAVEAGQLRPGDVLVLPAAAGGLDRFGWNPLAEAPVIDVADLCETRAGVVIRLDPDTLGELSPAAAATFEAWKSEVEAVDLLVNRIPQMGRQAARALVSRLRDAVRSESHPQDTHGALLAERLDDLLAGGWELELVLRPGPTPILRARRSRGPKSAADVDADHRSDADETTSLGPRRVLLAEHSRAVAGRARAAAERLGLAKDLVEAIALAAELHDVGKADPRFQLMLRGGDDLAYVEGDSLLAKSGIDASDRGILARARRDAGWPAGLRHEALSLALIDSLCEERKDGDLVRHLVATHHGYCRPLFDVPEGVELVDLEAQWDGRTLARDSESLDSYVPDWSAPGRHRLLLERHGAWGLALLETILRLADMTCSEAGT
ncbi:MAG TPA: type I-U CRISPR-associated helicase/endonuclease Cas3 [Gaiellaceae bacterium]|nr:type I-U CRISPR-associated helicase/endonuclease Cas3 [Gaiellaceae bacterium]